jgi:hypothetical protein
MSAKGPAKGTATIQRLLDERRKYESWLVRLRNAAEASAAPVRERVEADYAARLKAVDEELKVHAEAARQLIAERYETVTELRAREQNAAERLAEGELRHTVGEYDDEQWAQFRKDALAELVAVREELQELEAELHQLEEVNALVSAPAQPPRPASSSSAGPAVEKPSPRIGSPPRPGRRPSPRDKKVAVDEQRSSNRSPTTIGCRRRGAPAARSSSLPIPSRPRPLEAIPGATSRCWRRRRMRARPAPSSVPNAGR